jgi:YggT family protein
MANANLMAHWYLQVPSLILAALIWLLVARLCLSLVLDGRNALMRTVGAITNPVVQAVGVITPRIVPAAGIVGCAILWLICARMVLLMTALAMGVRL